MPRLRAFAALVIVFVLHAALAGRYAVEQTFELSYRDMLAPEKSPQMVLQRIAGSKIV